MIASFLSNISAKYYKNPSMLSRVIAKNVGDVLFETQCINNINWSIYITGSSGSPGRYGSRVS